jgi:hypothetical protein
LSKETILTQGYELPLGAFQLFLASVDAIEFHDDDDDGDDDDNCMKMAGIFFIYMALQSFTHVDRIVL